MAFFGKMCGHRGHENGHQKWAKNPYFGVFFVFFVYFVVFQF